MLPLLLNGQFVLFLLLLGAIIVSLSFHEWGHAYAAKRFGDDTAERQGRLTVNPVAHIDPMGMLLVVLIGFGYARPVPVDPRRFDSMWGELVVAAAGPAMNLLIAIIALNLLFPLLGGSLADPGWLEQFVFLLVYINLLLMLFNLLPFGPLDGHYILPYVLPRETARRYREWNARYGALGLLGLVALSFLGLPVFDWLRGAATWLMTRLTFVG